MRSILVLAVAGMTALAGCGGGGKGGAATTPEGTVQALVAAVQAGDALGVAVLYDYVSFAQKENENWSEIPKGQQDLILKKMAEQKAPSLEASVKQMKDDYKAAKIGTPQVNGPAATVPLETARGQQMITLVERDGKWYLSG